MIMTINDTNEINRQIDRKFNINIKILKNCNYNSEKCECNICYDEYEKEDFVKLDCGHEFCKDCVKKSLQNEIKENLYCSFCRFEIKNIQLRKESIKDEFDELITGYILNDSLDDIN